MTQPCWITDQVEVIGLPTPGTDPAATGYDLVYPIGAGDRTQWMREITNIYLRGIPRGLRDGGRVYLLQGRDIFFSAPVEEVLTDADRVSWITGKAHGTGPNLIVDLDRGRRHRIDASRVPTPDGRPWHNRRGFKYVTPGCRRFVGLGPKPPIGAMRARSSAEVALERALGRHLTVDRGARRLRVDDGRPYPVVEIDICIPDARLVVEFDGEYWHRGHEERDRAKTARLRNAGLRVIRVREKDLVRLDPDWDVQVDRKATPDDMAREVLAVCQRHGIKLDRDSSSPHRRQTS